MTRIFLTVDGQNENIGDSILRRGLLKTFQGIPGVELHVNIGPRADNLPQPHHGPGNDARYMTAVGLDGTEITYESSSAWHRAAAASLLRGRVVLVQHAGERYFPKPRPWTGWRSLVSALGAKLHRGSGVQVGGSAAITVSKAPWAERAACRLADPVMWRDYETAPVFGVGGVMPDFAFGEGPDPIADGLGDAPSDRPLLAVSMRGDRDPLPDEKLAKLRAIADERGLELQVFTQVRRDGEGALRMAEQLHPGRAPIVFGDEAHDVWEKRIRELFRRSAIVASDRAHGVIIAATEGAIPLPLAAGPAVKASRLLRPAGFETATDIGPAMDAYLDEMLADPRSVVDRMTKARADLDAVRTKLRALAAR